MKNPTPDVDCKYGAPMGRPTARANNKYSIEPGADPFHLVRVPLDKGGYDKGGAYWGLGEPLYYFEFSRVPDLCGYVRGRTRDHAKAAVREIHPNARFFR